MQLLKLLLNLLNNEKTRSHEPNKKGKNKTLKKPTRLWFVWIILRLRATWLSGTGTRLSTWEWDIPFGTSFLQIGHTLSAEVIILVVCKGIWDELPRPWCPRGVGVWDLWFLASISTCLCWHWATLAREGSFSYVEMIGKSVGLFEVDAVTLKHLPKLSTDVV